MSKVVQMRDYSENVLETLERLLAKMKAEQTEGDGHYDFAILVMATKGGRFEVSRLGSRTDPAQAMGLLCIAKDCMLDEVWGRTE